MRKTLFAAAILIVPVASAIASSWHYVAVGNDETFYFFDAETVQKNKDSTVLVWVKTVQTTKPESDGSWASAIKWNINCSKRTIQTLMLSIYDQEGKFIKSNSNGGAPTDVIPDSAGEGMLKIACTPSFPSDKSSSSRYFKLSNNDPILSTRKIVESTKSQIDQAPK